MQKLRTTQGQKLITPQFNVINKCCQKEYQQGNIYYNKKTEGSTNLHKKKWVNKNS